MHHAQASVHIADDCVKARQLTAEDRETAAAAWSAVQADLRRLRAKFGARSDDVESDVSWRISRSIHTYDADRGSLADWSRAVVRSAIRDYMRRLRSDRCVRLAAELTAVVASTRDEGRERIARDELADHVFRALGRRARLIAFARADGCSYEEAARIAGIRAKSSAYNVMSMVAAAARASLADL